MGFVGLSPLRRFSVALLAALPCLAVSASFFPTQEVHACLTQAAQKHGIAQPLLFAIAEQESRFNPQAKGPANVNGSVDYGLLQINSAWLPFLKKYGITAEGLLNPCVNADVGAWILAENFRKLGITWTAVGAYNAATDWKRIKYATEVYGRLQRWMTAPAAPSRPENAPSVSGSRIALWEAVNE